MKSRVGQVTVFVIIGLIIVAGVLVYFLWVGPSLDFRGGAASGFEGCVATAITGAVTALEPTVGLGSDGFTYQYNGQDIPYVCYTNNFYETCTVQQPLLKKNFERGVSSFIEGEVQGCFDASVDMLKSQGYEVRSGSVSYGVDIEPGIIQVPIRAPTTINGQDFTNINVEVTSPLYEMLIIATTILQQESRLGDADTDRFNILQPDFTVLKFKRGDGTTIYTIRSKLYGNEMQFASRSLAWPAGFDR